MSFFVLQVAIPTPLRRLFDYLPLSGGSISDYQPGQRVSLKFGSRQLIGLIISINSSTDVPKNKLKSIEQCLDKTPILSSEQLSLAHWMADYYHHSVGEVLELWLPTLLRKGAALSQVDEKGWQRLNDKGQANHKTGVLKGAKQQALWRLFSENDHLAHKDLTKQGYSLAQCRRLAELGLIREIMSLPIPLVPSELSPPLLLNDQQQEALDQLVPLLGAFRTCLLEGMTGSGKTEVYLQLIQHVLQQGKQALVLVPEIGLTPQTVSRFQERFAVPVSLMHSGLNDTERLQAWRSVKEGQTRILIGTRSAVFTPMPDLGLIIIDEEHDASFKQQDGLRYSARDFALIRAQQSQCPVLLGSATPSLESLNNALSGRYMHLTLNQRAGKARPPSVMLHSILHQPMNSGLSEPVLNKIHQHLQNQKQVLVFINRRGYAPMLTCQKCGWMAECHRCDARMTLHQYPPHLHCHHCDHQQPIPSACEQCGNPDIEAIGQGTERLESQLAELFPKTKIHRVDRDKIRTKQAFDRLYDEINRGDPCLLIGTQMLAKGHHFPKVTLVVILDTDAGLFSSDFRGMEHTAQLINQVSGRAGRAEDPGEVWIQTLYADHPSLNTLVNDGYHALAQSLLKERMTQQLPPFTNMAILRAESEDQSRVNSFLHEARQVIQNWLIHYQQHDAPISLLGPMPAIMERRNNRYRFQLQLFCQQRAPLHQLLDALVIHLENLKGYHQVRWSLDVDPLDTI